MNPFLHGILVCGFAVAALFFARHWRSTRDRFFVLFAAAFALMALGETGWIWIGRDAEREPLAFVPRLLAFVLILVAIADKNRARR